jgi:PEP-CTERM motif
MKFAMKSIVAAAAFVAAGVASAAPVTVPAGTVYSGLKFTGSGALSFSQELLDALNTGSVSVAPYGGATATTVGSVGAYTAAGASAQITALTIDGNSVVGAQTVGGATQTAVANTVSTGGSLTVTDLNVDLTNKKIFATIIGANGVGTLTNFELWDIEGTPQYAADGTFLSYDASTAIVGPTTISGPGTYVTTLNGLKITTAGFNTFVKALGLKSLGKSALQGVDNFGTVTSTITATAAIPEPSTYALMGLGLLGMGLVSRRRAK